VYSHQCHQIVATNGLELGQHELGARAAAITLQHVPHDANKNLLEQYKSHLSPEIWARISMDPTAATVTPSVPLNQNTEPHMNARGGVSSAFKAGVWRVLGPVILVVIVVVIIVAAVLGGCRLFAKRSGGIDKIV
jgi:hypothetical protein